MPADITELLNSKLKSLDKETDKGIFPELSREIVEGQKFLIVSYGGTGADALYSLKKNLEKNIDEDELDRNVRMLCIDTDKNTQYGKETVYDSHGIPHVETVKIFKPGEFFWLDNAPAKQAISLGDNGMEPWINPQLPARIRTEQTYLDGYGASSTRQVGRLLLYPQTTVNNLESKIRTLVKDLTDGNTDSLKIFIITGISGGTGSGIVIDATYLIRSFIEKLRGNIAAKTQICGFIMLPPTGTSNDPIYIEKGNRNGIAALKEIDHYMTIAYRGETYAQQFGLSNIITTKNIFDTCYLLDGGISNMVFKNPREKANEVVSDCILDMITSLPVAGTSAIQTVDSFMSDVPAVALAMVSGQKEQVAPREANYIYCAIGHGKVLIPMELMKAYVAANAFNKIYDLFQYCSHVSEDDVDNFLDEISIAAKAYNEQAQAAKINEAIDENFKNINRSAKKGGPYYTINLLTSAATKCDQKKSELENKLLVLDRDTKVAQLSFIKKYIAHKSNETFSVYVEVMEQLKTYFQTEHDILCDSQKFQTYTGATYTFTPINFSALDERSKLIRDYLDDLVNQKQVSRLTDGLIDSMISKRAEWTELAATKDGRQPRFNAADVIRKFWQENIGKIVNSTIEDFLIKYYSGDMEACYKTEMTEEGEEETAETKQWLEKAAEEIVKKMMGPAGMANPIVALRDDIITKDKFNGKNFFLVPQAAPHLKKYIEKWIETNLHDKEVIVAASYANDRISCYAQYTGIPAYMLDWAKNAEKDYERFINSADVGLHMSETKGGRLWRNYPNPIVESIWSRIENPPYENRREKGINDQVEEVFNSAVVLGLAQKHALAQVAEFGYYCLLTLPENNRPDSQLFKNVDGEIPGSKAREDAEKILADGVDNKANELFALAQWQELNEITKDNLAETLKHIGGIEYQEKSLQFSRTVLTAYTDNFIKKPENWEEILGAKLLRTMPEFIDVMRGTVLVMEKLFEMVCAAQQVKKKIRRFAQLLAADLFFYNDRFYQWNYVDGIREKTLLQMEVANNEQKSAEFYFMFKEYEANTETVEAALADAYEEKTSDSDIERKIEKQKAYKERALILAETVKKTVTPDRMNSNQASIVTTKDYQELAELRGYNVDDIIEFYQMLEKNLKTI